MVNTAVIMVGAVLIGLVIGFVMLFVEDQRSKK
jgi:predicted benzoate:H+ symporter BenE